MANPYSECISLTLNTEWRKLYTFHTNPYINACNYACQTYMRLHMHKSERALYARLKPGHIWFESQQEAAKIHTIYEQSKCTQVVSVPNLWLQERKSLRL